MALKARAERAEAERAALRAQLESAITVSINGALHRVLPAPVGYAGTDETVWLVEHGKMHVQPFALWPNAPDDAGQG